MKRALGLLGAMMWLALPVAAVAAEGTVVSLRHIDVMGEGRLKVKPDKADVQFTVFAEDKELGKAKTKADEKLKAVLVALEKIGIAKADMQTQYSSIMPRYRYESSIISNVTMGKQIFEAYEAQYGISVTVKSLDKTGLVLQKLTDLGIDRMGGVQYGLLDERPVKEKALSEAITLAKRKADLAAQTMQVKVGKVISFTESGAQFTPMPMMDMARAAPMMKAAYASPEMASVAPPTGEIEVSQSVSISYGIEDE